MKVGPTGPTQPSSWFSSLSSPSSPPAGCGNISASPRLVPAFSPPSSWVLLRLLPAKQRQYPSALLWKECNLTCKFMGEKKRRKKGKGKKKKNRTSRIFFLSITKLEGKLFHH